MLPLMMAYTQQKGMFVSSDPDDVQAAGELADANRQHDPESDESWGALRQFIAHHRDKSSDSEPDADTTDSAS